MTEAEVVEVETALGVKLPAFYRNVLLNYPKDLLDYFRTVTHGEICAQSLHPAPAGLIAENRRAREWFLSRASEGGEPWLNRYFVIGNNGGDNQWCIRLDAGNDAVYGYDYVGNRFYVHKPSLSAYVARLREWYFTRQDG